MKKMLFKIKVWLFWLFEYRLYPTSDMWSKKLENLISDGHIFTEITDYSAKLGDEILWIANCPYASFRKFNLHEPPERKFIPNKEVGYKLTLLLRKSIQIQKQAELKKFEASL